MREGEESEGQYKSIKAGRNVSLIPLLSAKLNLDRETNCHLAFLLFSIYLRAYLGIKRMRFFILLNSIKLWELGIGKTGLHQSLLDTLHRTVWIRF